MSTTAGRVFSGLTRASLSRGVGLIHNSTVRLSSARFLALSSQRTARSTKPAEDSGPIKFSTSKASHKTWKVDHSMGSQDRRPYWKILPFSVVCSIIILWCGLREESSLDTQLRTPLTDHVPVHVPGSSPDQDQESKVQNKSS